jgi:predicted ATP-grasp superfamily ATP-dependent carboligase
MNRVVLLVSTASLWLGTARMTRAFAKANFEVSLLAPTDSLAAKSRYVTRLKLLPDDALPRDFLAALTAMITDVKPRLLVPCDEMALRLLFALILEPPDQVDPAVQLQLAALVRESLGDPTFYETSIDKLLLPPAAEALAVRVPRYCVADSIEDAAAFAAIHGYPIVLKRRFGFAGEGVAIVATTAELAREAPHLMQPNPLDLGHRKAHQLLVQEFVEGAYHSQALVAWRGNPLASFAWERHVASLPVKGQTTVVRFVRSPESRAFAETLCRAFGISGFLNVQFVMRADTGEAHLLEINRRIVTHMHMGERVGADLPTALHDHLRGDPPVPSPELPGAFGPSVAVFPREWLRDPRSRYLNELPVDVPWDEPELLEAMLAMRH